jgi:hypothetical protein
LEIGRWKGRDTYRGDFVADAEVVKRRRKEAMWAILESWSNAAVTNTRLSRASNFLSLVLYDIFKDEIPFR